MMPAVLVKEGPNKGKVMHVGLCMLMSCNWRCSNLDREVVREAERKHWKEAHA
jgi:hypothetical protein